MGFDPIDEFDRAGNKAPFLASLVLLLTTLLTAWLAGFSVDRIFDDPAQCGLFPENGRVVRVCGKKSDMGNRPYP